MKILITGGAGFIGSHLCDRFVKDHTILCLDNFMNGNLQNIRHLLSYRNFKLINGDIRDFDLMEKIMPGVDVVFHLAAQIHVDRSIIEPKLTYDINVLGTLNVLEIARMYDVGRVVHASTSEVYGSAMYTPMDENHPLNAPHPYGASKIAADRMCKAFQETYGMDICIMRPFNIYGPRQKDSGYGGAISIFTRRVLNNQPPIIYGDGNQSRDYTYIKDIVTAYELVGFSKEVFPDPINFGRGFTISINNLAKAICRMCGSNVIPVHVDARPGEVQKLLADNRRASAIGWKPEYTLEKGLAEYIDWYRNYRAEDWSKPT